MMRDGDDASCAFTTLQFDRALMMSSYVGTEERRGPGVHRFGDSHPPVLRLGSMTREWNWKYLMPMHNVSGWSSEGPLSSLDCPTSFTCL
jgi:hypothetical protein